MHPDRALRHKPAAASLRAAVAPFQKADLRRSIWQVANTFIPFFVLWYLMYRTLPVSYLLTLALAIPTSGFLVRIFIILHDCGHGSFFASQRANNILGSICGVLTFTAYFQWRHDHAMHHATTGDLDRRGAGDVYTLTVAEYLSADFRGRLHYRVFRHPLVLLTIGPVWSFLISQRRVLPSSHKRERWSVYLTNVALLLIVLVMALTIGLGPFLLVQAPVTFFAAALALWLFYCQHQFEGTYWARHEEWDYETAALRGSSYFHMSRVLQWFTGNIGFHHIHHLNPRIPNYNLEASHNAHPRFREATRLTFWSSVSAFSLKLWDEENQRLVTLRQLSNESRAMSNEPRAMSNEPRVTSAEQRAMSHK